MNNLRALLILPAALVLAGAVVSCGDDGGAEDAPTACKARVTVFCRCPDGEPGWQTCADDGSAFDECKPCDSGTQTPAKCGDGTTAGNEECDDGNTDGSDACTTSCRKARCGDGFAQSGVEQCDDGNSEETDGCDSNCKVPAALADRCPGSSLVLKGGSPLVINDDTNFAANDYSGSCGGSGADTVFEVEPRAAGTITATVTTMDPVVELVVYAKTGGCVGGAELGCNMANAVDPTKTQISFHADKAQKVYVFVDGNGSPGKYTLELSLVTDVPCDGAGEGCDTGKKGVCKAGKLVCMSNMLVCTEDTPASAEACGDSLDNDCDGAVDNGCSSGCSHDKCTEGGPISGCDGCVDQICASDSFCCDPSLGSWDGLCVSRVASVCGLAVCKGACDHAPCESGAPLDPNCDFCVEQVCAADDFCCSLSWDSFCVDKVSQICGLNCS